MELSRLIPTSVVCRTLSLASGPANYLGWNNPPCSTAPDPFYFSPQLASWESTTGFLLGDGNLQILVDALQI